MSREQAYLQMLNATARIQWNVAMILEAKALEAEKFRNWMINHMTTESFNDHESQFKQTALVHEHVVETVESLTKLGQGLNSVLKAITDTGDDSGGGLGDMGGMGDMFGGSFDSGDRER